MEKKKTDRGFDIISFNDLYDVECSLQKSSLATEDAIWFGPDDANPQILIPGTGWHPLALPDADLLFTTRMHLSREQVKALLPHLQKFVDTGDI